MERQDPFSITSLSLLVVQTLNKKRLYRWTRRSFSFLKTSRGIGLKQLPAGLDDSAEETVLFSSME
jgi:hypothetical protein